jgi:murein DD-endopeptidase MepM/ murein hydrolase activator NlpD
MENRNDVKGSTQASPLAHGIKDHFPDLGNEPPLLMADEDEGERGPILRAVSWRWLTGTVLTGVTSILLMGTALLAALSNPSQFAELPSSFSARAAVGDDQVFGRKGDRIRPGEQEVSSRQVLQVSTVIRNGDRDFIKLRPFARITAPLSARRGDLAPMVPEYDARRIFADTSEPEAPNAAPEPSVTGSEDRLYGGNVDGEVAVSVSAFPIGNPDLEPSVALSTEEVEKIVRGQALQADGFRTSRRMAALAYADNTSAEEIELDDDLDVRIVPENLSNIAKSDDDTGGSLKETLGTLANYEGLNAALIGNAVTEADALQIAAALSRLIDIEKLEASDGNQIRIGHLEDSQVAGQLQTVRVSIYRDRAHQATVARADNGVFIRADEPSSLFGALAEASAEPEQRTGGVAKLYESVYEAALEQQIPEDLIDQLIRIFAFDVDFQARTGAGDVLEVFHSLPEKGDDASGEPEVLYASLIHSGTAKRFYRFRTPDDSIVDYYDAEGKSAKKFLLRKPVTEGVLRSRYGMRRHPVLKVSRKHSGVDFAAPRGTPILAAGNGIVAKKTRSSGYGNLTVLRHTNGYETVYAHQSRFAKGLQKGARVRQGQVIGYVGSTGLSTGPHLHYEIRVNGKAVDPLRIRLPRGRVLQADLLASFEAERQRIDSLLGIGDEPTQLASSN